MTLSVSSFLTLLAELVLFSSALFFSFGVRFSFFAVVFLSSRAGDRDRERGLPTDLLLLLVRLGDISGFGD